MISKVAHCPVGKHTELGFLVRGEVCSFVCRECMFIFTWDEKSKLRPPVKLDLRKKETCDCGGCQTRDENKYFKGREA